jgi:hypothetical protein
VLGMKGCGTTGVERGGENGVAAGREAVSSETFVEVKKLVIS